MQSLRDLQFELNKRRSAMMELDYKRGLELPTIRWVINERDVASYKERCERARGSYTETLEDVYRQALTGWDDIYDNAEFQRFGTAPVRDAYWSWDGKVVPKKITPPEILQHFDPKLLSTPAPTMVFRRYPILSVPEYDDILVKALLGFPELMGYKQSNHRCILDDSWTVNLRSTEKENIMMEEFLKGFAGKSEELKQSWEGKQVIGVDVSEELKDLYKVYTDAEQHLKSKEDQALSTLESAMKRYLDAKEERKKVTLKLNALKHKLSQGQPCEGCDDEDEDEGDDE